VKDVARASLNEGFQRQRSGLGMDAPALKVFELERAKNPSHLLADALNKQQFLLGIPLMVG